MDRSSLSKKEKIDKDFKWVIKLADLMDGKFKIGTFRFGLDPLFNFFPIVGQTLTFATSVILVVVMFRNGVSSKLAVKMLLNTILDALLGSIPIAGNIFDFFFKANQRNVAMLRAHYYEGKNQGSAKGLLTALFLGLLVFCILLFYGLWRFGEWFIQLF